MWPAFGDIKKSATYNRINIGTYDPATGTQSKTTTSTTLEGFWYKDDAKELDGDKIVRRNLRFLIKTEDISFRPSQNDSITIDSIDFEIIHVLPDPTESLWTLYLRTT